ncbi:TonB-dependent receptor [bacterium]|nr:TonB-dependent receptor [bacterium]
MKKILFFTVFIFTTSNLYSQTFITGVVKDADTDELLIGANVFLKETKRGSVANTNAYFSIPTKEGTYTLLSQYIGYKDFSMVIEIKKDEKKYVVIRLHAEQIEGETITVTADKDKVINRIETSVIDVKPTQVKKLPGAFEDVFRSVATLPGVISTSDFSSQIVVRGGNPDQNLILLDGAELFNPYRLFGVTSAFNPQTVSSFELSQGGFPARFGDRLSGVLQVQNRNGNFERLFAGNINASITDANLIFEGRLPQEVNGSWLFTTRRTYYDLVANKFIDGATALPFFLDFQGKISVAPWEKHSFSFLGITSREGVDITAPDQKDGDSIRVFNTSHNNLLSGSWFYAPADNLTITSIMSYYQNPNRSDFGGSGEFGNASTIDTAQLFSVNLQQNISSFTLKQEYDYRINAEHQLETGFQYQTVTADIRWKVKQTIISGGNNGNEGGASLPQFFSSPRRGKVKLGVYAQDTWKLDPKWTLQGGLRFDYAEINDRYSMSPRLNAVYKLDDQTRFKGAWGVYYQSPGYEKFVNQNFFVDYSKKIDVKPEMAIHYILGMEHFFNRKTLLKTEVYYKPYYNLIAGKELVINDGTNTVPILFQDAFGNPISPADSADIIARIDRRTVSTVPSNGGKGYAYGFEVFLQRDSKSIKDKFSGWVSYAYSVAKRKTYGTQTYFDFDQRHTLSLVGNYLFTRWFEFSAKLKVGSGFPATAPVGSVPQQFIVDTKDANGYGDGVADSIIVRFDPNGRLVQTIDFGGEENKNLKRLPVYHRLDLRASFYARFWGAKWTFYLDAINVYDQKNVFQYDYEFRKARNSSGQKEIVYDINGQPVIKRSKTYEFPFLPTIGLSMVF